jgi:hypothetical protein
MFVGWKKKIPKNGFGRGAATQPQSTSSQRHVRHACVADSGVATLPAATSMCVAGWRLVVRHRAAATSIKIVSTMEIQPTNDPGWIYETNA